MSRKGCSNLKFWVVYYQLFDFLAEVLMRAELTGREHWVVNNYEHVVGLYPDVNVIQYELDSTVHF